jgi:signal transduction histidine kinase
MSAPLLKCLFAEDAWQDCEIVQHELRGLATVEQANTRDKFAEALKQKWDAVFVDLRMPDLDGNVAINMARDAHPDTPILVITGSVDDETASIACQAGACDYLRKDRLHRLRMAVSNAVEAAEAKRQNEERKLREIRNQQSELIGELSIGLSHDMNGILGVIMAGTDMLRRDAKEEDIYIINAMESSSRHGAQMLRQLLLFAAGEGGTLKILTPGDLLGKVGAMLRGTFPSNIHLDISTMPGTSNIQCNELEMTKCILNLAINSRDAMPSGGKLNLMAQNHGGEVRIVIRDNGTGIPEHLIPMIFEPFLTTKKHGTGLGLSMAKRIIEEHQGRIAVRSSAAGTEFQIYLPVFVGEKAKSAAPHFDGKGKHILLVEDTEFLRAWTKLFLEESNYIVHEAATGPEAMSIFLKHSEEISALISDVWLPAMSGPLLAKALLELNSSLPLIFVTGLDADAPLDPTPSATLQKPFTKDALLLELQRVLLPVQP